MKKLLLTSLMLLFISNVGFANVNLPKGYKQFCTNGYFQIDYKGWTLDPLEESFFLNHYFLPRLLLYKEYNAENYGNGLYQYATLTKNIDYYNIAVANLAFGNKKVSHSYYKNRVAVKQPQKLNSNTT